MKLENNLWIFEDIARSFQRRSSYSLFGKVESSDKRPLQPCGGDHKGVVETLINLGADIEAKWRFQTPLTLACYKGNYEAVKALLSKGANKDYRTQLEYTPLDIAALHGHVNIIKLLVAYGAQMNSWTDSTLGISPLMQAASNNSKGAVEVLLDLGSDINAVSKLNLFSALHFACWGGYHEVASVLLVRGAFTENRDKDNKTPLMLAANRGHLSCVQVLLDNGAHVNAFPIEDSPLWMAAAKGHYLCAKLLLSRLPSVNMKDSDGKSLLWHAAFQRNFEMVELLLNAGADADSSSNKGISCLMAAVNGGSVKAVEVLLPCIKFLPSVEEMHKFESENWDIRERGIIRMRINDARQEKEANANANAILRLEEILTEQRKKELKKERRKNKKLKMKEEKKEKYKKNQSGKCLSAATEGGKIREMDGQKNLHVEANESLSQMEEKYDTKTCANSIGMLTEGFPRKKNKKNKKKRKGNNSLIPTISSQSMREVRKTAPTSSVKSQESVASTANKLDFKIIPQPVSYSAIEQTGFTIYEPSASKEKELSLMEGCDDMDSMKDVSALLNLQEDVNEDWITLRRKKTRGRKTRGRKARGKKARGRKARDAMGQAKVSGSSRPTELC